MNLFLCIFFLLIGTGSSNTGFEITNQPGKQIERSTTQTITWSTLAILKEIDIDLYQSSSFIQKLGQSNKNDRTFAWHVSSNAACGDNYFIKVSAVSINDTKAWANTQTFSICNTDVENVNIMYLAIGLMVLLSICYFCYSRFNKRRAIIRDPELVQNFPTAYPVGASHIPVAVNPVTPTQNNRYGFGTGFLAGVAADELIHHTSNQSSWFDQSNSGNDHTVNFGSGDFGTTGFGGGGGDNSGGFS